MRNTSMVALGITAIMTLSVPGVGVADELNRRQPSGAEASREGRRAHFQDAKFGMFIHWGLYAIPARGEWVMAVEKVSVPEYAKLAEQFNPVKFDAEEWVRIAKDAGMRYMVITAKHHDGFAMYGSKASPFNIVETTPFKRDPLKELAEACRREGIGLGFYYSHSVDWHHPGGSGAMIPSPQGRSFNEYMDGIVLPQLRELLTGYGPVFSLWFDMPSPQARLRAREISTLVRSLQPGTIINSRLMYGGQKINLLTVDELNALQDHEVDYLTYADRQIPAQAPWPAWETCMTLNESWGYTERDRNWKTPEELVEQLVKVVSRGGNFLLNVGPTAEGLIPEPSVRNLKVVGDWLNVNGSAIYGTDASPLGVLGWGRCTAKLNDKGGTLYLHVFDWPEDGTLLVPGLRNRVSKARFLADGSALEAVAVEDGLELRLPAVAPDAIASVIELKIGEPLSLSGAFPGPNSDGILTLTPETADLGGAVRVEEQGGQSNLGRWSSFLDTVSWTFGGLKPGMYELSVDAAGSKTSQFVVLCGTGRLNVTVEASGGLNAYRKLDLGQIEIGEGKQTLTLVPVKHTFKPINLRSLTLKPSVVSGDSEKKVYGSSVPHTSSNTNHE